jgi:hypothetical protein
MSRKFCADQPCEGCPFIVGPKAVRLMRGRIHEIVSSLVAGASFPCHKTVEYDDEGEGVFTGKELECTGAIMFLDRMGRSNQMTRIAGRLGIFDPSKLKGRDVVFKSLRAMLATALDNRRRLPARPAEGAARRTMSADRSLRVR